MLLQKKDLIPIMHSHRAYIYYLEHCKVVANHGVVEFISTTYAYNIPIANTTFILLGEGTSITNQAIFLLNLAQVHVAFVNHMSMMNGTDFVPLTQSYKDCPNKYLFNWIKKWGEDETSLDLLKQFCKKRVEFFNNVFKQNIFVEYGLGTDKEYRDIISKFTQYEKATSVAEIQGYEGNMCKSYMKYCANVFNVAWTKRDVNGTDVINQYINIGNHITYGIASTALWVVGIPSSFGICHGKTNKGALLYDVADIIKTAFVISFAFYAMAEGLSKKEYIALLEEYMFNMEIMKYIIVILEEICEE